MEATRQIMETQPTPIVIVSGSTDPREVATTFRAMEAGALAVLRRPAGVGHPDHAAGARELVQTVKLMSEVMAHTITLHLLDAPGRLSRFQRKHPELAGRIPKKELAAYLNLTPETLSRLKQRIGRI